MVMEYGFPILDRFMCFIELFFDYAHFHYSVFQKKTAIKMIFHANQAYEKRISPIFDQMSFTFLCENGKMEKWIPIKHS